MNVSIPSESSEARNPLALMCRHATLLRQLCLRDVSARYRGAKLGLVWAILSPLLMLAVYTTVFGVVFKARWAQAGAEQDTVFFALMLYSGLMSHQFVAEILSRSTSVVVAHSNYVKKVVFPLHLLSMVVVSTAMFNFAIQFSLLLVFALSFGPGISLSALAVPLLMLPMACAMLGISWIVASLGVFLRDLEQIMTFIVTLLMFLSPIFYPVSAMPEAYRPLLHLNPLTAFIEPFRGVLFQNEWPNWSHWAIAMVASLAVCQIGYLWFLKTRKGFNDVL